jgi:hypothetical protein
VLVWLIQRRTLVGTTRNTRLDPQLAAGRIPGVAAPIARRLPQGPETYPQRHVGSVSHITHIFSLPGGFERAGMRECGGLAEFSRRAGRERSVG